MFNSNNDDIIDNDHKTNLSFLYTHMPIFIAIFIATVIGALISIQFSSSSILELETEVEDLNTEVEDLKLEIEEFTTDDTPLEENYENTSNEVIEETAEEDIKDSISDVIEETTISATEPTCATIMEGTFVDCSVLLDEINEYRAEVGSGSLVWDASMQAGAEIRSYEICESMSHTRPDGTSFSTVTGDAAAENLARGSYTLENIIYSWSTSESHYAAMVNPVYTEVYVTCYETASGNAFVMHLK